MGGGGGGGGRDSSYKYPKVCQHFECYVVARMLFNHLIVYIDMHIFEKASIFPSLGRKRFSFKPL